MEVSLPIRSAQLRARLDEILSINLRDDVVARELQSDGTWLRTPVAHGVDSQALLHGLAHGRGKGGE